MEGGGKMNGGREKSCTEWAYEKTKKYVEARRDIQGGCRERAGRRRDGNMRKNGKVCTNWPYKRKKGLR